MLQHVDDMSNMFKLYSYNEVFNRKIFSLVSNRKANLKKGLFAYI